MVRQGRQQQEPTEAALGRLNAAPERRRNPLPLGGGEDVKESKLILVRVLPGDRDITLIF